MTDSRLLYRRRIKLHEGSARHIILTSKDNLARDLWSISMFILGISR